MKVCCPKAEQIADPCCLPPQMTHEPRRSWLNFNVMSSLQGTGGSTGGSPRYLHAARACRDPTAAHARACAELHGGTAQAPQP